MIILYSHSGILQGVGSVLVLALASNYKIASFITIFICNYVLVHRTFISIVFLLFGSIYLFESWSHCVVLVGLELLRDLPASQVLRFLTTMLGFNDF